MNPRMQVCPPTTVTEVLESMFEYLDRLFRIVRPRRLLYLAVGWILQLILFLPCCCLKRQEPWMLLVLGWLQLFVRFFVAALFYIQFGFSVQMALLLAPK